MLVKTVCSMAGADFSYRFGEEVDAEVFAANVGNGWENLCEPIETADAPPAPEVTVEPSVIDLAILPSAHENTSRRGRRK